MRNSIFIVFCVFVLFGPENVFTQDPTDASTASTTGLPYTLVDDNYISNDLNLTKGPYLLQGSYTVTTQSTLFVEAGVTLLLASNFYMNVYGKLLLNGTQEDRISIRPLSDETVCNGRHESVEGYLEFSPGNGSSFEFVDICGLRTITAQYSLPRIQSVKINYGSITGNNLVYPVNVNGLQITNSQSNALYIQSAIGQAYLNNVTITNTTYNGIEYSPGYSFGNRPQEICDILNTTVISPVYVRASGFIDCLQVFSAEAGKNIQLIFLNQIPTSGVEIRDGDNSSSPLLWDANFGGYVPKKAITSSSKSLWIKFANSYFSSEFIVDSIYSDFTGFILSNSHITVDSDEVDSSALNIRELPTSVRIANSRIESFGRKSNGIKLQTVDSSKIEVFDSYFVGGSSNRLLSLESSQTNVIVRSSTFEKGTGFYVNNANSFTSYCNKLSEESNNKRWQIHVENSTFLWNNKSVEILGLCLYDVLFENTVVSKGYSSGISFNAQASYFGSGAADPVVMTVKNSTFKENKGKSFVLTSTQTGLKFNALQNSFINNFNIALDVSGYDPSYSNNFSMEFTLKDNIFQNNHGSARINILVPQQYFGADSHYNIMLDVMGNRFENNLGNVLTVGLPCNGSKMMISHNWFSNPQAQYQVVMDSVCSAVNVLMPIRDPINITYNWWGLTNSADIIKGFYAYNYDYSQQEVNFIPYYTSNDMSVTYQGPLELDYSGFKNGSTLSGQLNSSITLPASESPYFVKHDINILEHGELIIEPGAELKFMNNHGMLLQGKLVAQGTPAEPVKFSLHQEAATNQIRLVSNDQHLNSPFKILEVKVNGTWGPICSQYGQFPNQHTGNFLCSQLGYHNGLSWQSNEFASIYSRYAAGNYTAVSGSISCNEGSNNFEDCLLQPCEESREESQDSCSNCQLQTIHCNPDYWAGIHVTDVAQPSIIQHAEFTDAGTNHFLHSGASLKIDYLRHSVSHLKIVAPNTGILISKFDLGTRESLTNIDISLKSNGSGSYNNYGSNVQAVIIRDYFADIRHCQFKNIAENVPYQTVLANGILLQPGIPNDIFMSRKTTQTFMCNNEMYALSNELNLILSGEGWPNSTTSCIFRFHVNDNQKVGYSAMAFFRTNTQIRPPSEECYIRALDSFNGQNETIVDISTSATLSWVSKGNSVTFELTPNWGNCFGAVLLRFFALPSDYAPNAENLIVIEDVSIGGTANMSGISIFGSVAKSEIHLNSIKVLKGSRCSTGVSLNTALNNFLLTNSTLENCANGILVNQYSSYNGVVQFSNYVVRDTKFSNSSQGIDINLNQVTKFNFLIDDCTFATNHQAVNLNIKEGNQSEFKIMNSTFLNNLESIIALSGNSTDIHLNVISSVFDNSYKAIQEKPQELDGIQGATSGATNPSLNWKVESNLFRNTTIAISYMAGHIIQILNNEFKNVTVTGQSLVQIVGHSRSFIMEGNHFQDIAIQQGFPLVSLYLSGNATVRQNEITGLTSMPFQYGQQCTSSGVDGNTSVIFHIAGKPPSVFQLNVLNNPNISFELWLDVATPSVQLIDISQNFWGQTDDIDIKSRIKDGRHLPFSVIGNFYPFYLSPQLDNLQGTSNDGFSLLQPDSATFSGGPFTGDLTLQAQYSPYIILNHIVIGKGSILTLEAGTELQFLSGVGITVYGRLIATGNENSLIVLKHLPRIEETYSHFELRNGWAGIQFMSDSDLSSEMRYVSMENISYSTLQCPPIPVVAIQIFDASPVFDHVIISKALYGVHIISTKTSYTLSGISIYNMDFGGVLISEMNNNITLENLKIEHIDRLHGVVRMTLQEFVNQGMPSQKFRISGSFSFCDGFNSDPVFVEPGTLAILNTFTARNLRSCSRTFATSPDYVLAVNVSHQDCLISEGFNWNLFNRSSRYNLISETNEATIHLANECMEKDIVHFVVQALPKLLSLCSFSHDLCNWHSASMYSPTGYQSVWTAKPTLGQPYACGGNCSSVYIMTEQQYRVRRQIVNPSPSSPSAIDWRQMNNAILESPVIRPTDSVCSIRFNMFLTRNVILSVNANATQGSGVHISLQNFSNSEYYFLWQHQEIQFTEDLRGQDFSVFFVVFYPNATNFETYGAALDNLFFMPCNNSDQSSQELVIRNIRFFNSINTKLDFSGICILTTPSPILISIENNRFEFINCTYLCGAIQLNLQRSNVLIRNNYITGHNSTAIRLDVQPNTENTNTVKILQNHISSGSSGILFENTGSLQEKINFILSRNVLEGNSLTETYLISISGVAGVIEKNFIANNMPKYAYIGIDLLSLKEQYTLLETGNGYIVKDNVVIYNTGQEGSCAAYCYHTNVEMHNNVFVNPDTLVEMRVNTGSLKFVNATDNWWGSNNRELINNRLPSTDANVIFEPFFSTPPNIFSFSSTKCNIRWNESASSCVAFLVGAQTYRDAVISCQRSGGSVLPQSRSDVNIGHLRDVTRYMNINEDMAFTSVWIAADEAGNECMVLDITDTDHNVRKVPCTALYAVVCENLQANRCPNSCFGLRGVCQGSTCLCNKGYSGEDCSQHTCYEVANCSNHGDCIGPNQCQCQKGWEGKSCSSSSCRRNYDCDSCTKADGCGWCDDLQTYGECYPGTPSSDYTGTCRNWFYYRCSTTEDSSCSTYIKKYKCASDFCNGLQYNKEKCQACVDYDYCFSMPQNSTCKIWDESKCPGGIVQPNYDDPQRIISTVFNENVKIINPNDTLLYYCPVRFSDLSDDATALIISQTAIDTKIGDILSSAQSGGIMHRVEARKSTTPYTLIKGGAVRLEEVVTYADFRQNMDLIPLDDEQLVEYIPEPEFLYDVITGNVTSNDTEIHVVQGGVFKCVGHGYEVDENDNIDYSFYLVLPATDETRAYTPGMILAGNHSSGYLETVTKRQETSIGTFVEARLTQCTDDSNWNHRLSTVMPVQDLSCSGGTGWDGLHLLQDTPVANSLTVGDTFVGRQSGSFIAQIAKTTENNGYMFFEVIAVTELDAENITTGLDLSTVKVGQRVKRGVGNAIQKVRNFFNKNFKPKFSGKVTATTTVRVTFEPRVKLSLHVSSSSPYVHEVGVNFNGKLEGFVEQRIDFEGSFSASGPSGRYAHPINNKQVGRFALPIWPYPLITLPGRFLFDVTFKVTMQADVKGFLSASITATGTMDTGATWRAKSGLDFQAPKFGFGVSKIFDGGLDEEKTKASFTATLTPSLKAQWPTVPTLPSYIKWILPGAIEDLLGLSRGRQSISILQAVIASPFFLHAWANACSDRCKDPEKPLQIGVRGGLKAITGTLNVKAFGYQKNFNFLKYSNEAFVAVGSTCIGQPFSCCICGDGSPGIQEDGNCKCECFCDAQNTVKSLYIHPDGECECDLCPDDTPKKKKSNGELGCPCDCLDGSEGEQNKDGTCNCKCQCEDGSTDTVDVNGDCPCACKCKNCEDSTLGPEGCICPNDICPVCKKGEPKWVDCECKCVEEYECGVPPACVSGRKGPKCETPDCSSCNNCNGHGSCRGSWGSCNSYCQCASGWLGRCCDRRDPRRGSGDPHFTSLDGSTYDFQGIGEYWDCISEENDFGIQVRFWASPYGSVSLTGGIAVKAGDSIVTIMTYDQQTVFRIDGIKKEDKSVSEYVLADSTVVLQVDYSSYNSKFSFVFINDLAMTVDVYNWGGHPYLNYMYSVTDAFINKTRGLCGSYDQDNTNDFTARNGMIKTPYEYGLTWKIESSSNSSDAWSWTSSNFHPDDAMDFDYTNPSYTPRTRRRRDVSPLDQQARDICNGLQLTGTQLDNCIFDIIAMNSTELAKQDVFYTALCPTQCYGHGSCINGACNCTAGWYGDECQYGLCGSFNCSVNGECISAFCQCKTGWEGPRCDVRATCYNVNNCTDEDHGVCKTTDVCLCVQGFTGLDCSVIATCYNRNNCSNNGVCIDIDVCQCNTGWTGDECTQYSCQSLDYCSAQAGQGLCVGFDVCSCTAGWTGLSCNLPDCPNVNQCSNHGTCTSPDNCQCNEGYTGASCDQIISCPSLSDCNGHGQCFNITGTETCLCDTGYIGATCSNVSCSAVSDCSGHGHCEEPDVCTCDLGYQGTTCSEFSCESHNFCSAHGDCTSLDMCMCNVGWFGASCNQANCSSLSDCSNQGQCITPDLCECLPGFDGTNCSQSLGANNFPPEFQQVVIPMLSDTTASGVIVLTVNATDMDSGRNAEVRFMLLSETNTFVIDTSGVITTVRDIDFDIVPQREFQIIVKAYDQGLPQRSATVTYVVSGQDANDNCPVFDSYPTVAITISQSSPLNTNVTSVHASDADSGLNGQVLYSIVSENNNPSSSFNISASGEISTAINEVPSGMYLLTVVATDMGSSPCTQTVDITVNVVTDESLQTTTQVPTTTTMELPTTSTTTITTELTTNVTELLTTTTTSSTELPTSTTELPSTTTELPTTATEPLTSTTELPSTTTEPPSTTTKPPTTTTELPSSTTETPSTTTEPPSTTTELPTTTTEPLTSATELPSTTTEPPSTTTELPTTTTEPLTSTTELLSTTTEPPSTTTKPPTTTTENPTTANEPTTTTNKPPATTTEPPTTTETRNITEPLTTTGQSSTTTTQKQGGSDSAELGLIIGVSVPAAILLVVLVVIAIVCMARHASKTRSNHRPNSGHSRNSYKHHLSGMSYHNPVYN